MRDYMKEAIIALEWEFEDTDDPEVAEGLKLAIDILSDLQERPRRRKQLWIVRMYKKYKGRYKMHKAKKEVEEAFGKW